MLTPSSAKRALLAPFWALQIATGAKSFEKNPFLGSHRLNAKGLHRRRVEVAAAMVARRRKKLEKAVPAPWIEQFDEDGFIVVPKAIPGERFGTLRRQILEFEAQRRDMAQGNTVTRRMAINPAMLGAIPTLRCFLGDPKISAAMRYVASFDSEPLHYVQAILKAADGQDDPQTALHADTFHSSMKSWLFLDDVPKGSGAFTFVPGSHRLTEARLCWEQDRARLVCDGGGDRLSKRGSFRISPEELGALGLPKPREMAVPANTLIIADTFGFHARGRSAGANRRVEIWSYLRRNPFLPWAGGDPLSSRWVADKRVDALWTLRDRFRSTIGQPWRPAGIGSIVEP